MHNRWYVLQKIFQEFFRNTSILYLEKLIFLLNICSIILSFFNKPSLISSELPISVVRLMYQRNECKTTFLQNSHLFLQIFMKPYMRCIVLKSFFLFSIIKSYSVYLYSYREIYRKHSVLYNLQLLKQSHPRTPVTLHQVPFWPSVFRTNPAEAELRHRRRKVSYLLHPI